MSTLQANEYVPFEQIKHFSEDGSEFWYARELSLVLDYVQWRNFAKVLDRAKIACKNSGYEINHHFAEVFLCIVLNDIGRLFSIKAQTYGKGFTLNDAERVIKEPLGIEIGWRYERPICRIS